MEVKIPQAQKSYPISIEQDKIENLKQKIDNVIRGQKYLVIISEKSR